MYYSRVKKKQGHHVRTMSGTAIPKSAVNAIIYHIVQRHNFSFEILCSRAIEPVNNKSKLLSLSFTNIRYLHEMFYHAGLSFVSSET